MCWYGKLLGATLACSLGLWGCAELTETPNSPEENPREAAVEDTAGDAILIRPVVGLDVEIIEAGGDSQVETIEFAVHVEF